MCRFAFFGYLVLIFISQIGCNSRQPGAPVGSSYPVQLSNPRIVEQFGNDFLNVEYSFSDSSLVPGDQYQLLLTWPDGETSKSSHYFNEKQSSGLIEVPMTGVYLGFGDRTVDVRVTLQHLDSALATYKTVSNEVRLPYTLRD